MLLVLAASLFPVLAGAGTPLTSSDRTTYRYDVTVTGRAHTAQRHSGDQPGRYSRNGTVDLELVWTSTFRNVTLKKISSGADTFVIGHAGGLYDGGTTDVTFSYDHARQDPWGPCAGSFSLEALPSRVVVGGYRDRSAGRKLTFLSQLRSAPAGALEDRIRSACKHADEPRWIELQGAREPDLVRGGLTWRDVDPITLLTVSVERTSARQFSLLSRLARGEGFTIQTGVIRNEGPCHFGTLAPVCVETFEGALTVKLVPRRR